MKKYLIALSAFCLIGGVVNAQTTAKPAPKTAPHTVTTAKPATVKKAPTVARTTAATAETPKATANAPIKRKHHIKKAMPAKEATK